jgi:hypothetical protein
MHFVKLAMACAIAVSAVSHAHPGGLNAEGCHNNRKTGDYHCHGPGMANILPARQPARREASNSYFPNCASARAAGVAPLRRGDAGYRPGLDRDNDGIACE